MTATPESPVGEGGEANKNSESAESKPNGSTINEEKNLENTTEKEMPPNEADMAAAKAPTSSESAPLASSEDLKVKFSGGARGSLSDGKEVKLEIIGDGKKAEQSDYPALTKSELMEYAKDPFWIRLRWTLFVFFWLIWLAMLVASIVIIVMAPKCPPPTPKEWWQKAPIYEVYVKSFKDSDGDGVGDIKGVTSKIDYLASLGIGSVWMSSVYKAGSKDNGYDVINHKEIDAKFGTMEDFKDLVKKLHDAGIKLIMDFIPNHTSKDHQWFIDSVANKPPYNDYYVWKTSQNSQTPPTQWKSKFGGPAWKYDGGRNEWYLHHFYEEQPDLNLRKPEVVKELKEIMKFWLDLGVDGFRVDSVAYFFEDEAYGDEKYSLPETLTLLKEFRDVLDEKTKEDTYNPRVMMTEGYKTDFLVEYYGEPEDIVDQIGSISQMPLFFDMIEKFKKNHPDSIENKSGPEIVELVDSTIKGYQNMLPFENKTLNAISEYDALTDEEKKKKSDPRNWPLGRAWPNYNIGNHDNPRAANRFGTKLLDAMNMVIMMLQGSPITYYGDEIGMEDFDQSSTADKRAPYRTPMQWDDTSNAGFTNAEATPWLSINTNYKTVNVAEQENEKENEELGSHLKVYKELAKLRYSDSILYGNTNYFTNQSVFAYTRVKKGNPGYLIAVNFGKTSTTQDFSKMPLMPKTGTVQVRDSANNGTERSMDLTELTIPAEQGIIMAFVPDFGKKTEEEKLEDAPNVETAQE